MTSIDKIKVVHVINSFEFGGAEAMLCNLVLRSDRARFSTSVVSLIDDLTVASPLLDAGVPIAVMGFQPGAADPRALVRLARYLRSERPGVVQTWMDHSNLIGGVVARAATRARVVWGVHHADHGAGVSKRSTRLAVAACARLSRRVPARVVCCSEQSRVEYLRRGFAAGNLEVIPNGFDTDVFRPDPAARFTIRRECNLDLDAPLVGLAARFDPVKDHATFLKAAARLARWLPEARFLLCGARVDDRNPALTALIDEWGLAGRCRLLGPRRDMPRVLAALDVAASSSLSEAFPLAVGEAMACGVPCVGTNVGDTAAIIGPTGRIVPPRDPDALARSWLELLELDPGARRRLGLAARERVRSLYDLTAVTGRYEALYSQLAATTRVHDGATPRVRVDPRTDARPMEEPTPCYPPS